MQKTDNIYYIGFNANNAICNESFFAGSITLYPNREKGNIYYSNILLDDTSSQDFMDMYKDFVHKTALEIQMNNHNSRFMFFNKKIKNLCSGLKEINFVENSYNPIIDFFNDKYKTRKLVSEIVPILDYLWLAEEEIDYKKLKHHFNDDSFVIQGISGAGGNNTFYISSEDEFNEFIKGKSGMYGISNYMQNIPINITMVVGNEDISLFPISIQYILLENNRFKYYGGDFAYVKKINAKVISEIKGYSTKIGEKMKKEGYRGVLGIDYILTNDNKIYFMEINPRFQSSSFLINLFLEKKYNTCLAEQHYLAITNQRLSKLPEIIIDRCFVNCNKCQEFDKFDEFETLYNGYFADNSTTNYRKIFNSSIYENSDFEGKDMLT